MNLTLQFSFVFFYQVRLMCDIEVETKCRLIEGSSPEVSCLFTLLKIHMINNLCRAVKSVLAYELKGLTVIPSLLIQFLLMRLMVSNRRETTLLTLFQVMMEVLMYGKLVRKSP